MTRFRRGGRLVALLLVAGALAAASCGDTGDRPGEGDSAGLDADSVAARVDSATAGADGSGQWSADDPFAGFELEAGPEAGAVDRRIALLLRNHSDRLAVVYADGGAGEVLLDSVPAGSDSRVDIVSRASMITLRSLSGEGDLLRVAEVTPAPDTVIEVMVGAASPR